MDTFEAYNVLHLPIDQRNYSIAVRILEYFGISEVKLLTNNPHKIKGLISNGIKVKRVPIEIRPNKFNKKYLLAKKNKMGHLLKFI